MTSSARSEILARLRDAGRGTSAERIALERQSLGSAPAANLPEKEICHAFLTNVLKNQGSVECVVNRAEAVTRIGQYLYKHFRSQRLVAGNDARLAALPWRDAGVLPRFGSLEDGEPVALSYARLGIAESGAIVTFTGKANPAANNLLPVHHIVLVDVADLVSNLEQAWDSINLYLDKKGRPRGINFIAGPSSTADIEGQLVYGAHGPRHWHVVLLGDVPAAARVLARTSNAVP
jgi:L-lactate dehydrogenase complex protein LldG